MHSFGLPQMRIKQDAMPGVAQPVWFTPTMNGEWDIACAQLCGLGHYRMRGMYAIQSQAQFDAWLAKEATFLTSSGSFRPFDLKAKSPFMRSPVGLH